MTSMPELSGMGRILILVGGVLVLIGVLLVAGPRIPFLGRLPGDILVEGKGYGIYFPVATCILLSLILSVLLNTLFRR